MFSYIYSTEAANSKGTDQTTLMHRWTAFDADIQLKQVVL